MRTVVAVTSTAVVVALLGGGAFLLAQDKAGAPAAPIPTSAEARAVLAGVVEAAAAGELTAVCAFASEEDTCAWQAEAAPVVPAEAPTVTCEEEYTPGMPHTAGRILHLTGQRTDGAEYQAEFFVTTTSAGARAVTPVYWTAQTVQRVAGTPASTCG
jgi:hypothetical protein